MYVLACACMNICFRPYSLPPLCVAMGATELNSCLLAATLILVKGHAQLRIMMIIKHADAHVYLLGN